MKTLMKLVIMGSAMVLASATALADVKQGQKKTLSAQTKTYQKHERHWQQPRYATHIALFKCFDSYGHRLRGKFSQEQKYFIELGGGNCYKKRRYQGYSALTPIAHFDFPIHDVERAVRQVQKQYGLRGAKLVDSQNIDAGFKTFKYTLVFKVGHRQYREFRIKHHRWSGDIRKIREV